MTSSNVVGLDLSLTSTGLASITGGEVDLRRYRSAGKKGDDLAARQTRISGIVNRILDDLIGWYGVGDPVIDVDLVVVESPSYGSQHGSPHDRSGLWWLIVNALREMSVPVAMVSPQGRAKYGTGKGNAKKVDVFAAVREQYPHLSFACDDEADALILAAMGSRHLGLPIDPWLEGSRNLEAMAGASWPT